MNMTDQQLLDAIASILDETLEAKLEEKLETKLEEKLDVKLEEKLEEKLDAKLEEKLDVKLEEKLDAKLEEKLRPVYKRLDQLNDHMEILRFKQESSNHKLEDLAFKVTSMDYHSERRFHKLEDEMETLITVMEARRILPSAAQL